MIAAWNDLSTSKPSVKQSLPEVEKGILLPLQGNPPGNPAAPISAMLVMLETTAKTVAVFEGKTQQRLCGLSSATGMLHYLYGPCFVLVHAYLDEPELQVIIPNDVALRHLHDKQVERQAELMGGVYAGTVAIHP